MSHIVQVEPLTTARALRGPFDYVRPDGTDVGSLLEVPFGRQRLTAVVTGVVDHSEHRLAAPLRVLPDALPADLVDLGLWLAREYASTPARALSLLLPPRGARERVQLWAHRTPDGDAAIQAEAHLGATELRLTGKQGALLQALPRFAGPDLGALRRLEARGLVEIGPRGRRRAPQHTAVGIRRPQPGLTADQQDALDAILATAATDRPERLLLHGVTGSGKTEVYLRAAAATLERGRAVLILVPEIGLTPQMIDRFVGRFGDTVAVLHSKLGAGERYDEWRRLRSGAARVCVGPRSAVFAPMDRLGLVVVDEEHDGSYKNEGDPRYDARLVAEKRALQHGAVLVCGSATPRPESVHALRRVRLPRRVDGSSMPAVEIVDLRHAPGAVHPRTHEALVDARKAIVLLNRRGWSNFLTCRSCGRVWECPQCDVALVLHRSQDRVACHHCGHAEAVPGTCPDCGSISIARHGAGTERLEHDLAALGRPVLRLDADVRHAGPVLAAFERADSAILVGTQVVAKGHDFPDVDLGVVLDADATLRFPDFRAEERTFALVTQLAGRAGRGNAGARVLVQTIDPTAPAIAFAARHDSDGFLRGELERREALRYPPFSTLIRIVCSSESTGVAHAAATAIHARLPGALGPAPLFRLRGRERSQVVLKGPVGPGRRAAVEQADAAVREVSADKAYKAAAFSVDVDAQ
ncbi:primosomal protein N' [Baekduia soli]|uniref:Replication restart protein PriA n=1 Tax=Baekduia soli TaxID=496014 RepID=A0A5B8U6B6_9ACTN|nr:primosomal protein N' [Baekduia soli]QEC48633.1 primosomal protein N' [Baekduia soli]